MKCNLTKTTNHKQKRAFTLIEMIGVLAVIAILAAVLIPKVFEAINNSRINNTSMSCETVKTAIGDHYAKFGTLPIDGSSNNPVAFAVASAAILPNFDTILMKEQFLDKPFAVKIGDGTVNNTVELVGIGGTTPLTLGGAVTAGGETDGFALSGGATNQVVGSVLVQAKITGVTEADAQALSQRIDGPTMSTAIGTSDTAGRVKYVAATPTTVYVYVTHR